MSGDLSPEYHFGYDIIQMRPDISLMLPVEILEQNNEYTIIKNSYGTTVKNYINSMSTPGWLGHTINSRDDWMKYRDRLIWNDKRINYDSFSTCYSKARKENKFITYSGAISWDAILQLIGSERLLTGFYDEPEWIHEMFDAALKLYIDGYTRLCELGFEFDGAWVYDDMAYNGGLFFSPDIYKEFFFMRDKLVCDVFRNQGKPVILHSCGNIKEIIPWLIQSGYSCIQPVQVSSGMDLNKLMTEYGENICFMGGVSAQILSSNDYHLIEEEIKSKVRKGFEIGGYFYHSDHSVPDNVKYSTYLFALNSVLKYGKR